MDDRSKAKRGRPKVLSGKSIASIDAQIELLKRERLGLIKTRADRIADIAVKAGLGELGVPEDALKAAFAELASRFRKA